MPILLGLRLIAYTPQKGLFCSVNANLILVTIYISLYLFGLMFRRILRNIDCLPNFGQNCPKLKPYLYLPGGYMMLPPGVLALFITDRLFGPQFHA